LKAPQAASIWSSCSYSRSSAEIVAALAALEDRPWAEYGRALSKNLLASLLRPFDIHSVDIGPVTARVKGYRQKDCQDAFERYLSGLGFSARELDSAVHNAQTRNRNGVKGLGPSRKRAGGVAVRIREQHEV
jgi:hypothetical protein